MLTSENFPDIISNKEGSRGCSDFTSVSLFPKEGGENEKWNGLINDIPRVKEKED